MATYDPPQPLWKRNTAGILDFFLAGFVFGYVVTLIFGSVSDAAPHASEAFVSFNLGSETTALGRGPVLLAFALVIAYFVILGQTGGTVFQRLFRMQRAKSKWFHGREQV